MPKQACEYFLEKNDFEDKRLTKNYIGPRTDLHPSLVYS